MKLNLRAFTIAQMFAAGISFIFCGFFVGVFPDATESFTKFLLHTDMSGIVRSFSFVGFIVGLVVVTLGWGLFSLIIAGIYNRLTERAD